MKKLTPSQYEILINKGTERAFSGAYWDCKLSGIYHCAQCQLPLFDSKAKFDSGTGWPSFDEAISNNVERLLDADGRRIEIVCAQCKGHLGHLFENEGFTPKQKRYCVNSLSLELKTN